MEIEIPRRLLWGMLSILLALGPVIIGILASPSTLDEQPRLLTPRLARVSEYRRDVRGWVKIFQETDTDLRKLLEDSKVDLFDQNSLINRVYQQARQLAETIDQTAVPPTFEPLHEQLGNTANSYLEAAALIARWISEPSDENRRAAAEALSKAEDLLDPLYANPWVEVKP